MPKKNKPQPVQKTFLSPLANLKVLFIDPSISSLGWSIFTFNDNVWQLYKWGTYHAKTGGLARLPEIARHFQVLAMAERVDRTVIEDPGTWARKSGNPDRQARNLDSLVLLNRAIGALFAVCPDPKLYKWKGNESKEATSSRIKLIYKRQIGGTVQTSEHCRDSIAMGHKWTSESRVRGLG